RFVRSRPAISSVSRRVDFCARVPTSHAGKLILLTLSHGVWGASGAPTHTLGNSGRRAPGSVHPTPFPHAVKQCPSLACVPPLARRLNDHPVSLHDHLHPAAASEPVGKLLR